MSGDLTPLRVVIFGRPGSGKSSLADRLGQEHGLALIRTGERLREAVREGDSIGAQVQSLLAAGQLVSDELVFEILSRNLESLKQRRLLFDGFPRTLGQIPLMNRLQDRADFAIDAYVEIAVSVEEALNRMSARRVCPTCGATYHLTNRPPQTPGLCDDDQTPLIQRADDAPEVLRVRQAVYDEYTGAVVEHYRVQAHDRFHQIDANRSFDLVYNSVCQAIGVIA